MNGHSHWRAGGPAGSSGLTSDDAHAAPHRPSRLRCARQTTTNTPCLISR